LYRLIIADDEPIIREGLFRRINWASLGYEVAAVFEDGSNVLDFLKKQQVDVLLTDIRMYQVSGLQAAREIHVRYPWMKVILFSGYREFEYAQEARRCGVYEYILKPIDFAELKGILTQLKNDLDRHAREDDVLKSFGVEEYEQLITLIHSLSYAVLDEGEETWLAYAKMKPVVRDAPPEVRKVIIQALFDQLYTDLQRKDSDLALKIKDKMKLTDDLSKTESTDQISDILKQLNDEIVTAQSIPNVKFGQDDCIMKACKYINNHLSEDFTYKDVAEFVHLSPRHFIRRFQSELGETFTNYLIRIRITNAQKLLNENKYDASDICRAVGYHNEKYFGQLFKNYTGYTVRSYLRQQK
jgi:two-component system response regulator YesN